MPTITALALALVPQLCMPAHQYVYLVSLPATTAHLLLSALAASPLICIMALATTAPCVLLGLLLILHH